MAWNRLAVKHMEFILMLTSSKRDTMNFINGKKILNSQNIPASGSLLDYIQKQLQTFGKGKGKARRDWPNVCSSESRLHVVDSVLT